MNLKFNLLVLLALVGSVVHTREEKPFSGPLYKSEPHSFQTDLVHEQMKKTAQGILTDDTVTTLTDYLFFTDLNNKYEIADILTDNVDLNDHASLIIVVEKIKKEYKKQKRNNQKTIAYAVGTMACIFIIAYIAPGLDIK